MSLVDGPRDLKFEMTARAWGRERAMDQEGEREMTSRNKEKVLRYRGEEGLKDFEERAERFAVSSRFPICRLCFASSGQG